MNKQIQQQNTIKIWLSLLVRMSLFAVAIMWPAGTWRWWEAWVLVGLWTGFAAVITVYLSRHDPALLAERMKLVPLQKGQKVWDKVLMIIFFIAGFSLYIVPGFDVMRFEWSESLPVWLEILSLIAHVPCFFFIGWVMRENTYLSRVVKIDEGRRQQVITTGPYAIVRHPMYTAVIVLLFVLPVALGSRIGLIPAVVLTLLLIVRTHFEDRVLYAELEGYPEYAKQTPYRLISRIW